MPLGLSADALRQLCRADGGSFRANTLAEASRFCRRWARRHYENFPVASLLLPADLRRHVAHLYAFARLADDIADAPDIPAPTKLTLLDELETNLRHFVDSAPTAGNPVLLAFASTLRTTGLPLTIPQRLLVAFRYDACFRPFATWSKLLWYCHHSANPIGEALLVLHRSCTPPALCASNALCTALQVLNFWQDLSTDLLQGRLYLPQELLQRHGIAEPSSLWTNSAKLRACLSELSSVLCGWLQDAARLRSVIRHPRLRWQAALTLAAAQRLRARLDALGERVLQQRPRLGPADVGALLLWLLRTRASTRA